MNVTRNRGFLVLGVYLIFVGLIGLFGINLGHLQIIIPLLALVAGILVVLGK